MRSRIPGRRMTARLAAPKRSRIPRYARDERQGHGPRHGRHRFRRLARGAGAARRRALGPVPRAAGSRRDNLEGLPVEIADGDLSDPASLARALRACRDALPRRRRLPALGRRIRRSSTAPTPAARRTSSPRRRRPASRRVVYTSSVARARPDADGSPATRRRPSRARRSSGDYKKSKYDAERVAEAWAAKGLPVVIVNPSTPVGELRHQADADRADDRRLPEPEDAGLRRHGAEPGRRARRGGGATCCGGRRGRSGERYILGNREHDAEGDPRHARAADRACPRRRCACRTGFRSRSRRVEHAVSRR